MVRELNVFYQKHPALWEHDFEWMGYEWIDFADTERSVISYLRKGNQTYLVCVHNFTPEYFPEYWVQLATVKSIREVFNTDEEKYGGSGKCNPEIAIFPERFKISLSPLATLIFEVEFG